MTPLLRPGDRVVVVSPAGSVPAGRTAVDDGVAVLRSWGLDAVTGAHARDVHPTLPYLAGLDADRASDLVAAWLDPSVRGVLCARGGYGSQRVVDLVDWAALVAAGPKVFLGSSDLTAVHDRLAGLGVVSWFGPMVATDAFLRDEVAREHCRAALLDGVVAATGTPVAGGTATGTAFGGTVSLLGPPPPDGAVALLEEVNEEPYRLDRMLTGLLRAGWFDRVAGIALGSWHGCGDVTAVLHDRLAPLGVPIVGDVGFGHRVGQRTVPHGASVRIDGDTGAVAFAR
ncbi:LD-carboxypeptidase [Actinosynnema sp. NPDC020468]|uniref:S66 peptidase family protein n=1 Tax=Actinosynnema sp. NPDC020468 TaxID=3154488 RepID=UPI0033EAD938